MKKMSLAILVSLTAVTGAAYAQGENGVTMSTDPATAAAVEQHAQELQSRQESMENMPMHEHEHHPHHKMAPHHKMEPHHKMMMKKPAEPKPASE